MKLGPAILTGLASAPAMGALVGLADCLRALAEGGNVLTPRDWLATVAVYAAVWIPLGLLAGLKAGLLFRRGERAAVLAVVAGTAGFAVLAYENVVRLPSFTAPESLRFDAIVIGAALAVFFAFYFLPLPVPRPRARSWAAVLVLVLLVAGGAGLLAAGPEHDDVDVGAAPAARPNVLVFLADAMRADHLGAYGYPRDTSPAFDAFAAGAVLFENCRAASTWTKPSTASIMTGLLPAAHGAVEHREILSGEAVTLAEVFRSAGYATGAFSDNPFVTPEFGFGQGFEHFDRLRPSPFVNGTLLGKALWTLRVVSIDGVVGGTRLPRDRGSAELSRRLLAWLDGLPSGEPWFAYVHAMEPHTPYDPPAPFRGRFADPGYRGPDHTRPPRYQGFLPFEEAAALPAAEREHVVARYDEEIATFDDAFGKLLASLDERGLLGGAIVVVLSDHGEEFHEHGGWTHGHSLYEELVRVPLAIRAPGLAPRRESGPVRLTDLMPTLAGLAGLRREAPFGLDLSAALRAGDPIPERPVVSEVRFGGAGAESLVEGGRKLIRARRGGEERILLFDLAADPREERPEAEAAWAARLAPRLDLALRSARAMALRGGSRTLGDAEEEALRGLGYLGR